MNLNFVDPPAFSYSSFACSRRDATKRTCVSVSTKQCTQRNRSQTTRDACHVRAAAPYLGVLLPVLLGLLLIHGPVHCAEILLRSVVSGRARDRNGGSCACAIAIAAPTFHFSEPALVTGTTPFASAVCSK